MRCEQVGKGRKVDVGPPPVHELVDGQVGFSGGVPASSYRSMHLGTHCAEAMIRSKRASSLTDSPHPSMFRNYVPCSGTADGGDVTRSTKVSGARCRQCSRHVVCVVVLVLLLAACSSGSTTSSSTGGDESASEVGTDESSTGEDASGELAVTAALEAGPTTLNPLLDTSTGRSIFTAMFDTLVGQYDAGAGSLSPRLASSWETDDATLWTFDLVPDVTAHNDEPITASDVVYTFETILGDAENPYRSRFPDLDSVAAVNDTTVEFQLASPRAAFPALLSTVAIVPDEYYEEVGRDGFGEAPVGSGPYALVEQTTDSVVLEANPDYWDGRRPMDTLTFQVIESASSRTAALESGDVDVVANIPPGDGERLDSVEGISVESVGSRKSVFIGHNVDVPGLDDPDVRRAVDVAIDRQAIVEALFGGQAETISQPTPSSMYGHDPSLEVSPYDPDRARELVESSSYADEEIVLYYPTSRLASPDQIAQAIVSYLQDVGLNVRAEGLEWATFLEGWVDRAIDGMFLFPYTNGGDPEVIIDSIYEEGSRNHFEDQEIFNLVKEQRAEPDPEGRAELLSELFRTSTEKAYYSWLYSPLALFGIRDGVPIEPSSTGRIWIE